MRKDSERNRINQFLSCNVLMVAMKVHVCTVHLHHGQVRFSIFMRTGGASTRGETYRRTGCKEFVFLWRDQHAFTPHFLPQKLRDCG
jgi:hypothetical protein